MCKNISFFYSFLTCNCRYTLCVTPANRGSPWRVPPWAVFVCVSYIYGNYETTYRSSSMWLSRATERLWYLRDLCKRNYPSTLYSSSTIYENYAELFLFFLLFVEIFNVQKLFLNGFCMVFWSLLFLTIIEKKIDNHFDINHKILILLLKYYDKVWGTHISLCW